MELKLIKYKQNKCVVLSEFNLSGASFIVSNLEYTVPISLVSDTSLGKLYEIDITNNNISIPELGLLKLFIQNNTNYSIIAVYDNTQLVRTRLDIINAIATTGDRQYYKYITKLCLMELAIQDLLRYDYPYSDVLFVYNELKSLISSFSKKYNYNHATI